MGNVLRMCARVILDPVKVQKKKEILCVLLLVPFCTLEVGSCDYAWKKINTRLTLIWFKIEN